MNPEDVQKLIEVILFFTLAIVTGALIWGLSILKTTLLRPDPANPKMRFIDLALSEPRQTTAAATTTTASVAGGNDDPTQPSGSKVGAALGTLVLAVMLLGVGYYMLWSLFTTNKVDLSSVGNYFLAGSALFAPYALDKLKDIFKTGS